MPYTTGTKTVLTLRKYIDGQPTDETKANVSSDPDYIPPYVDTVDCPIVEITTTTTTAQPTTRTTSTTVASTTTTTTAAPSNCYAVQLFYDASTTCPSEDFGTRYADNSDFCVATELYSDSSCTTFAPSGYYKDFSSNSVRTWNGTGFIDICGSCP